MVSLKAKKIKPLGTSLQSELSHRQFLCFLRMGMWNVAHCRYKQCYLYSAPTLQQLGGMKKTAPRIKSRPPTWYCRETNSWCQPRQCASSEGIQAQLHSSGTGSEVHLPSSKPSTRNSLSKMKCKLIPSPFPPVG